MKKLRLLAATLATVLAVVATPNVAMANEPEPDVPPVTSFFFGNEEDSDTTTEQDNLVDMLNELFENLPDNGTYGPGYGSGYGSGYGYGCDWFFGQCYNDPFYGSCQWDMFYGQYICGNYVPDFGCSWSYDYWKGGYPCTGRSAWGWY